MWRRAEFIKCPLQFWVNLWVFGIKMTVYTYRIAWYRSFFNFSLVLNKFNEILLHQKYIKIIDKNCWKMACLQRCFSWIFSIKPQERAGECIVVYQGGWLQVRGSMVRMEGWGWGRICGTEKVLQIRIFPLFSRKVLLYFILIGQVLTVIFLSIFSGKLYGQQCKLLCLII